jgi:hypothetical protein
MQPTITDQASWCADALAVQNACNLSGVTNSWHMLCCRMHMAGMSTNAVADHPACQLYAAKVADLVGLNYHYPIAAETEARRLVDQAAAEAKHEAVA